MAEILDYGEPALLDLLPDRVRRSLIDLSKVLYFRDGQMIQSRGDPKLGLSIIKSGAAHIGLLGRDGSFVTNSIFGPGHCFGELTLFTGRPRTHDVSASSDTEIYQVSVESFWGLFEQEPDLVRALCQIALIRSAGLLSQLDDMRRLPLDVRAGKFLLSAAHSSRLPNILSNTQADIAYALGASRVSIGKILQKFKNLNFIEIGYGKIKIVDPQNFKRWVTAGQQVEPIILRT